MLYSSQYRILRKLRRCTSIFKLCLLSYNYIISLNIGWWFIVFVFMYNLCHSFVLCVFDAVMYRRCCIPFETMTSLVQFFEAETCLL